MKDFWHGKLDMNHGKLDMKHGKLDMKHEPKHEPKPNLTKPNLT